MAKTKWLPTTLTVSALLLLIIGWAILSSYQANPLIYPTWGNILTGLANIFTKASNISLLLTTFGRLLISMLLALLVSSMIIVCYLFAKPSIHLFTPLLTIMKAVPLVSISLFLWLWVGGRSAPVIITLFVITPIMTEGLKSAFDNISIEIKEEIKLDSATNFLVIRDIYWPILFPYLIMTLLQSFGLGLKVMIMSEYLCQTPHSIGQELFNVKANLEINVLLAWTIVILLIVIIVECLLKRLNKIFA